MSRNASDPEHINLMFFLAVYMLCLWLLSFLLRFRTYYKLRSVLLGEQEAVSAGLVYERAYPGTFKGWDYDLDQEEWLQACQEGKYISTWSSRKRFAAANATNQATVDTKVRLQRRRALQRRNADFDVDVVYHPNLSKITSRLLVHCMRFPKTISELRRLFGVQNPMRATGTHVNYFHMDADKLLGKSLGKAVADAAEEASGGTGQGLQVPLHALKFGLTRTTISIGIDFPESPGTPGVAGSRHQPVAPLLSSPPPPKRRLRRKKDGTSSEPQSPQVDATTLTPSSPPLQLSLSGTEGSSPSFSSLSQKKTSTRLSPGECPLSATASDGAFGLPMRRQDTLGVSCYDKTERDAMVANGLRLMKIDVDVHRDINHKNIRLSALLLVSRQDLVVELWNSIARKEQEAGGSALHQSASLRTTTTNSQSVEPTPELTPFCSSGDYAGSSAPPLESSSSEQSSNLYTRRNIYNNNNAAGGGLSISKVIGEKQEGGEEGGDGAFSNFVKQVSTASIVNSPPLSLIRDDRGRRARIADDTALETSTDTTETPTTTPTQYPISPGVPPLSPTTPDSHYPPSALQGAYRKVPFVQVLHSDQLQQMEETCDDDGTDVFPIVLVVEHKQPSSSSGRAGGRRRSSSAMSEVAMVYCGRIVGGGESGNTGIREDAGGGGGGGVSLLVEFKLEYARIGGLLYGVETPVYNVGAPGLRARQVSLVKPTRRVDINPPPTWSVPTTPWGTLMPPMTPYGSPSLGNISHARTSSFRSCASIDSNNNSYNNNNSNSRSNHHFRTSSLNSSGISEDDSSLCLVCFEEERCMVFISCGHFAVCGTCLAQLADCPVCRTPIKEYLYLSVQTPPLSSTASTTPPAHDEAGDGALDRFVRRLKNLPARFEGLQQRCPITSPSTARRVPPTEEGGEGEDSPQELGSLLTAVPQEHDNNTATAVRPRMAASLLPPATLQVHTSAGGEEEQPLTPQAPFLAVSPLGLGGYAQGSSFEFDQRFQSVSSFSDREVSLPSEESGTVAPLPTIVADPPSVSSTTQGGHPLDTNDIGSGDSGGGVVMQGGNSTIAPSASDVFGATLAHTESGLVRSGRASVSVGSPPPFTAFTRRNTPMDVSHHVDPIFLGTNLEEEEGVDGELTS